MNNLNDLKKQARKIILKKERKLLEPVLQNILAIAPEDPEALTFAGIFHELYERNEQAFHCYSLALKKHPNFHDATLNKASILCQWHRYKEAEDILRSMLNSAPNDSRADEALGHVFCKTKHFEWAKGAYETAQKKGGFSPRLEEQIRITQVEIDKETNSDACKDRSMHILTGSGLGNRLHGVLYGAYLAKQLGATPIIYWPENAWCGCSFSDIFDEPSILVHEFEAIDALEKNIPSTIPIIRSQVSATGTQRDEFNVDSFHYEKALLRTLAQQGSDFIYSNVLLPVIAEHGSFFKMASPLKLQQDFIDERDAFCKEHSIDSNTQGLHIRKTDFHDALNENQWIERVKNNPQQRFFVCSDDEATEEQFNAFDNVTIRPKNDFCKRLTESSAWGANIQVGDKELPNINRSKQATIEGFRDMLMLGETQIIPTIASTFQQCAAHLKRIENAST